MPAKKIFQNTITKIFTKSEIFLLCALIGINFIFKWHNLENFPSGIEGDELTWGASALFTQHSIPPSSVGVWSLIENLTSLFPISVFLNRVAFQIFNYSIFAPRKMLVILSSISYFFLYFFLKKIFSKSVALVTLGWYIFSSYVLIIARIPLQHGFNLAIFTPSLFFLYQAKEHLLKNQLVKAIIFSLITSFFIILSIFTYNLTFLIPLLGLSWLIYSLIINKTKNSVQKHNCYLLIFIYCLPFIIFSSKIKYVVLQEYATRSYALNNAVNQKENINSLITNFATRLNYNFFTSYKLLFNNDEAIRDMLIPSGFQLVDSFITIFLIIGLIVSVTKLKKYSLLIFWLIINFGIYQLFLGLHLPRMWAINFVLITCFIGVGIETTITFFKQKKYLKIVGLSICSFLISFSVASNIDSYFKIVNAQTSFQNCNRDISDLVRGWTYDQFFETIVISNEKPNYHIMFGFYLSTQYPDKISQWNGQSFALYDNNETSLNNELLPKNLINYKYLVIDNDQDLKHKFIEEKQIEFILIRETNCYTYYKIKPFLELDII